VGLKRGLGSSALRDFAGDESGMLDLAAFRRNSTPTTFNRPSGRQALVDSLAVRPDKPLPEQATTTASYRVGNEGLSRGINTAPDAAVTQLAQPERGSSLPLHNQPAEGTPSRIPGPIREDYTPDTREPIRNPRGPAFNQDMARDADPAVIGPRVRTNTDLADRPPIPTRDSGEFPNDRFTTPPAPSISELKAQADDHAVRIHALLDDPEQLASEHGNSTGLQAMIDRYQALQDQIRDAEAGARDRGIADISNEQGFRQGVYSQGVQRGNNETYYREVPELDQAAQSDVALGARTDPLAQFRTNPDGSIKRFTREEPSPEFRTGRMVEDPNGTHGLVKPLAEQIRTGARPVTRPQVTISGKLKDGVRQGSGSQRHPRAPPAPEIRADETGRIVRDSQGEPVKDWDTADPQRLEAARAAGDPRALAAVRTNISDSAAKSLEGDVGRRATTIYKATHDERDPLRGSRLRRRTGDTSNVDNLAADEFGNYQELTNEAGKPPAAYWLLITSPKTWLTPIPMGMAASATNSDSARTSASMVPLDAPMARKVPSSLRRSATVRESNAAYEDRGDDHRQDGSGPHLHGLLRGQFANRLHHLGAVIHVERVEIGHELRARRGRIGRVHQDHADDIACSGQFAQRLQIQECQCAGPLVRRSNAPQPTNSDDSQPTVLECEWIAHRQAFEAGQLRAQDDFVATLDPAAGLEHHGVRDLLGISVYADDRHELGRQIRVAPDVGQHTFDLQSQGADGARDRRQRANLSHDVLGVGEGARGIARQAWHQHSTSTTSKSTMPRAAPTPSTIPSTLRHRRSAAYDQRLAEHPWDLRAWRGAHGWRGDGARHGS